jgi:hypothetical protein
LLKVHRAQGLEQLLGQIGAAVRTHRGPLEAADDATMVALRFSNGVTAGGA